ncbi:MAG TPA: hypothetical protein VFL76_00345 [Edaphocola sp.]|nr:hypothetical protein [Edaphocola sp.]
MKFSKTAFFISAALLVFVGSIFYPRWEKSSTEAQISWDASGYYWYLPSIFIYHDLKGQHFKDDILSRYHPTPDHDFQQGFIEPGSGHYVMKYTIGTAIMEAPFFFVADALATPLGYRADGFSRPYQFMIYFGGICFALLGLWYLRKLLLLYYDDKIVAVVLLLLVFGTNYLNYCGVDVGMTHNWLFTLYVFILLNTHFYYQHKKLKYALRLGALIGMTALIRPPEIIAVLIPLLWGMENLKPSTLKRQGSFLWQQRKHFLFAGIAAIAILSIQFIYWKYATGQWFVYSYQDQGFSWLHPHSRVYAFSYQSGWLTYTPLMIIVLLGIFPFFRSGRNKLAIIVMIVLNYYLVSAWNIYDYGGFGGRAMVQSYPVLIFLLAALIKYLSAHKWLFRAALPFLLLATYFNLWWTYQAHGGTLIGGIPTSGRYYWRTILRYNGDPGIQLLRDNKDYYTGAMLNTTVLYQKQFTDNADSFRLTGTHKISPEIIIPKPRQSVDRIRAYADVRIGDKEWNVWNMTQFIIRFKKSGQVVKTNMVRLQRILNDHEKKKVELDAVLPGPDDYDTIVIFFKNFNDHICTISNLKVIGFNDR